jgi:hypothetical protein
MPDSQMIQNGAGQAEIPAIGFIAKRPIGRDSIEALILQGIGSQLGHKAYAAPLLLFVDQESATFFRNCSQSEFQLLSAIATQ